MSRREVITAETCRSCGACCVAPHDQDAFCDVTAADEERLGRRFVRLNVLHSTPYDQLLRAMDGTRAVDGAIRTVWREQKAGPLKGYSGCACAALRGSVMSRVSCSVYERRPRACRVAVKPGDRTCREVRKMFARAIEELQEGKM